MLLCLRCFFEPFHPPTPPKPLSHFPVTGACNPRYGPWSEFHYLAIPTIFLKKIHHCANLFMCFLGRGNVNLVEI